MKIVSRYILREHVGPLVFSLAALTSLLLLNFIAKKFGDLVGKGLPWSVIGEFLLLSVPFTLAMTLPMAVLVATLHAFSRFAAENEITAFKASGVSMQRLVWPVIIAAFGLTLGMVWFNDQVLPRANHRLATLQSDIARVKPTLALSEQVINEISRGQLYLRAARIVPGTNRMHDVTIWDLSNRDNRRTIRADSGLLAFSSNGTDLILTLNHGFSTETEGNSPARLQRSFFREDRLVVRGVASQLDRADPAPEFRKGDREMTVCELHQRVEEQATARNAAWQRYVEGAARVGEDTTTLGRRPREPWGLADGYCALLTWWDSLGVVKEAEAAAPVAAGAQQGAAQRVGPPGGSEAQLPESPAERLRRQAAERAAQDSARRDSVARDSAARDSAAAADRGARPGSGPGVAPTDGPAASGPRFESVVLRGLRSEVEAAQSAVDRYRVEIEKKFAIAAACVVFVLLGAPIALRFPRGGVGLTIGVSLGVFAIYYVGLLAGEALADRGVVDPAISMWMANAVLGVVGVVLTMRLGSEGSTSRGSETSEWWGRFTDRWRARFKRRPA